MLKVQRGDDEIGAVESANRRI